MTTKKTIRDIISTFSVTWPDKISVNTSTLDIWHEILKDKTDFLVLSASKQWIGESRWSPLPSDIRNIVCNLEIGDTAGSGEAWTHVQSYLRLDGKPCEHLSTREIYAVEAAGGFWELRHGHMSSAFRKRFEDAYNRSIQKEVEKLRDLPEIRKIKKSNSKMLPLPVENKPVQLSESHSVGDPENIKNMLLGCDWYKDNNG